MLNADWLGTFGAPSHFQTLKYFTKAWKRILMH